MHLIHFQLQPLFEEKKFFFEDAYFLSGIELLGAINQELETIGQSPPPMRERDETQRRGEASRLATIVARYERIPLGQKMMVRKFPVPW